MTGSASRWLESMPVRSKLLLSHSLVVALLFALVGVFAVTQRGHGNSSKPETGYAPADFARDVAAFLDAVGLDSAIVVGHSMGSVVAQRFAIDHPARVRALVLEESAVVISPGSAYGPNGEGFFRISLTIADERLQEAVERLRGSLSR